MQNNLPAGGEDTDQEDDFDQLLRDLTKDGIAPDAIESLMKSRRKMQDEFQMIGEKIEKGEITTATGFDRIIDAETKYHDQVRNTLGQKHFEDILQGGSIANAVDSGRLIMENTPKSPTNTQKRSNPAADPA